MWKGLTFFCINITNKHFLKCLGPSCHVLYSRNVFRWRCTRGYCIQCLNCRKHMPSDTSWRRHRSANSSSLALQSVTSPSRVFVFQFHYNWCWYQEVQAATQWWADTLKPYNTYFLWLWHHIKVAFCWITYSITKSFWKSRISKCLQDLFISTRQKKHIASWRKYSTSSASWQEGENS